MKTLTAIAALLALTACTDVTYQTDRYGRTSVVHHHDDPCKQVTVGYLQDSLRIRDQWMQVIPGPCHAVLGGAATGIPIGLGASKIKPIKLPDR